ncbi:MAG TPA: hypothetical protein VGJ14_13260 [Sporichthyaceae bacterium]
MPESKIAAVKGPLSLAFDAAEALQEATAERLPRSKAVGPDPMIDYTVPINNDALHAAIDAQARDNTSQTEKALHLALARAVYLGWAQPHLISIRRPDGVRLVPPGLKIRPVRPRIPDSPLLVYTDERFMTSAEARDLQVLYAWEVFSDALVGNGSGVLVNIGDDAPTVQLTPAHCRKIRRLLGRSGQGPLKWPAGWPKPEDRTPGAGDG